jgi:ribosomal protein S21
MQVRRKEGESIGSFLYRFTKKVQHGGILKEARKRRFYSRTKNRTKRKEAAIYREEKRKEHEQSRKLGKF